MKSKREQLIEDGFCIYEDVLSRDLLESLREESSRMADARLAVDREKERSTGSMISVLETPLAADLVALPQALDVLRDLGYEDPRFTSGYIISKPPHTPRLFWHYDWAGWDDPGAFDPVPQQVFLMYYLVDTTRHNGCLRVVPGSHIHDNPLHELLTEAHTQDLRSATDLSRVEFSDRPDEVDVCVKAGDVVIGDSRILHASHANESDDRRTVITLWYHPDMSVLHEGTQAFIAKMAGVAPETWPADKKAAYEPLRATYDGDAEPLPWNRFRPNRARV